MNPMRLLARLLALSAILMLLIGCVQMPSGQGGTGSTASGTGSAGQGTGNATGGTGQPPAQNQSASQAQNQSAGTGQPPATTIPSKEISYTSEAWTIYGTLYPSENGNPTKAIILAHKLGSDRNEWPRSFIERLHDNIPDALILAIDLRGHGKSTNLGTWESFDMAAFKDMKTDILSAEEYIGPNYPAVTTWYVVGSSMGSTAAMLATGQKKTITRVVLLSPGMKYRDVDITRSVEEYRHSLLAVAANGDSYSLQAVNKIEELSDPTALTTKIYFGSAHGAELFDATKSDSEPLSDVVLNFLMK